MLTSMLLLCSVTTLALGPLVLTLLRRVSGSKRLFALDAIDSFAIVAVFGLVLAHVLPHAYLVAGSAALLFVAAGLAFPFLVEKLSKAKTSTSPGLMQLGLLALALHGFVDGVFLADERAAGVSFLALSVVLHRLPEGIALAWFLGTKRGTLAWSIAAATLTLATVAGFAAQPFVVASQTAEALACVQAFGCGAMLHVLSHPPPEHMRVRSGARLGSMLGAMGAVAVLFTLVTLDPVAVKSAGELAAGRTALTLALESAPALAIGYLLAAALATWLPRSPLLWLSRGGRIAQALKGVAVAPILPFCSCGVVPVYRSLVAQGAAGAAAIAFLVATPELGFASLLVSWKILGPTVTILRCVVAAAVAFVVAMVVGRSIDKSPPKSSDEPHDHQHGAGFIHNLRSNIDHTLPWIILGLGLGAMAEPLLGTDGLSKIPEGWSVPLFALIGVPAYICASAVTPLVAVLLHKGLSVGAALALLITGPATNVTTFGLLTRLHGKRIAVLFAITMITLAISSGYIANAFFGGQTALPLHGLADHDHGFVEWPCLAILLVATIDSIRRQGVRGFALQLRPEASTPPRDTLPVQTMMIDVGTLRLSASPRLASSCGDVHCSHEHKALTRLEQ